MRLIYISGGTSVLHVGKLLVVRVRGGHKYSRYFGEKKFPTFIICSEKEKILAERFAVCYKVMLL